MNAQTLYRYSNRTCLECDVELDIDGDDGACHYTGVACQSDGCGCDCGARPTVFCEDCETLISALESGN